MNTFLRMAVVLPLIGLAACGSARTSPASTASGGVEAAPNRGAERAATAQNLGVQRVEGLRLYALDCGRIEITDFGPFKDDGKPTGKGRTLVDPCFVVQHPKGVLLWDTGLDESIAKSKDGVPNPVGREFVDVSLREQLGVLALKPSDITFVGFSHLHADHAGNANQFTSSTWLVNRRELASATKSPPPIGVDPRRFSQFENVKKKLLDGDEDVFGDGSVRIVQTPGHTSGHQSLVVKLTQAGTIVLSGDLTHSRDNWDHHVVPSFNDSRENTIASLKHVERILAETHGRFVVQHAPEDFKSLPTFPAYLE